MTIGSTVKRIVCLANSRKPGGRCVAGKEILSDGRSGEWIRPIGASDSEAVSAFERQYQGGSEPRVLDLIDIPLLNAQPKNYQQENWLIDNQRYWVNAGRTAPGDLNQMTDPVAVLWLNNHSSYNGLNDRVPLEQARGLRNSLRLIKVSSLILSASAPGSAQGQFQYHGTNYCLRVTDPNYHRRHIQQFGSDVQVGECFLTISLGEPYQGHSYKLIAAIIKP